MSSRLIVAILSLAIAGVAFAQAYKWVDEDGIVHYTDRPVPGAERIILSTRAGQRTTVVRTQRPVRQTPAVESPATDPSYQSVTIASPGAEETLWNLGGTLSVSVSVQPALQQGHRVRVYFDGAPQLMSGTSFEIADVFRGVHNIQVEIIDASGQLKIRSQTNRFYVQQNSVVTRPRANN